MTRDYHIAETRQLRNGDVFGWQAACGCGWIGAERATKGAAEDDAAAHDIASND